MWLPQSQGGFPSDHQSRQSPNRIQDAVVLAPVKEGMAWKHCAGRAVGVPAILDRHSTRRRTDFSLGMKECWPRGANQRMA